MGIGLERERKEKSGLVKGGIRTLLKVSKETKTETGGLEQGPAISSSYESRQQQREQGSYTHKTKPAEMQYSSHLRKLSPPTQNDKTRPGS